ETDEQHQERIQCLESIVCMVFKKSGVQQCVRFPSDDTAVAFAGNLEEPELYLELDWQKANQQTFLIASLDDEVSWQEQDFESRKDFCQNITDFISQRVNATIKTVTESIKHKSMKITVYKMDNNGDWQLLSEDFVNYRLVRPFITKNGTEEIVKTYRI
ncbi:MAG: hypothetical protein IJT66_01535, partial [Clostridia bacterium]|nr:hypothetical protein [Clostridia bacterium]